MTSNTTILNDIRNNDSDLSESTLYSYLNSLNRLYVLEDVEAWQPAIRSKTAIRACNKKEFVDPSIAVAALDLTPDLLINDLNTFGFIFENLCIRDLRIYSSGLDASISYYHDRYDLEADCVIHLGNGKYGLIEIKLGDKYIDEGEEIYLGKNKIEVIHLPGHTQGGVGYLVDGMLFSGDSIFLESIGRTDLPGGNHKQLIESIKNKIFSLDGDTILYVGHGTNSTVEHEKKYNEYV